MAKSALRDRRRESEQRMRDSGFKQVRLWVPREEGVLVDELQELFGSKDGDRLDALRQFFSCDYELFLTDPDMSDADRSYFEDRVAKLSQ